MNNQSGTIVIDCSTGTSFVINLTGNVTTFSFSNVAAAGVQSCRSSLRQRTGATPFYLYLRADRRRFLFRGRQEHERRLITAHNGGYVPALDI